MHPDFHALDPLRDPNWRFERALFLLEARPQPQRPGRGDDKYVRTYLKFRTDYQAARQQAESQVAGTSRDPHDQPIMVDLFAKRAAIWYAHRIHTAFDSEWRAIVQARILARESDARIAQGFGTLPDTIFWFEKTFFDIRDRLDRHDWIVKTIFGPRMYRAPHADGSPSDCQRDLTYQLIAYIGGSQALDAILGGFPHIGVPTGPDDVSRWFDKVLKYMTKVKATTGLQSLEANKFNAVPLLALSFDAANVAGGDESDLEALEKGVEEALKSIAPFEIELRREGHRTALEEKYCTGPIEPRSSELLQISQGIEPPELAEAYRRYAEQAARQKGPTREESS